MTPHCLLLHNHLFSLSTSQHSLSTYNTGLINVICGNICLSSGWVATFSSLLISIFCIHLNPKLITVNKMVNDYLFFFCQVGHELHEEKKTSLISSCIHGINKDWNILL